ncbi:MAG: tyrosine-type recombinase/integrase [Dehalococcoidia bacterium]
MLYLAELTARRYEAEDSAGYSCNHLCNQFLSDRESRGLSRNTIKFYHEKLTYVSRCIAPKPILALSKLEIQAFLGSLSCNPGGKHAYLRALRAFYSWAEENALITANPCSKIKLKVPKPLRPTVKVEEIPQLLKACETVRDRLIVSMLADTGLRLSELASVCLSDVDRNGQTIRVWGKGAKQRVVRYGPQTATLLAQHLTQSLVRETVLGLEPRGISIMLHRLEEKVGIKCNAHAFRRTFATESVRNGLNLFHVQSLLGHTNLTMTRVYAEQVNSEDAIKAYKPIVT